MQRQATQLLKLKMLFSAVHFSHTHVLLSATAAPHGLQHTRPSCPSPAARVYSNSCPLSRWCHSTISSSLIPFFHHQFFPASESFPMSQFFISGSQSIRVSASASVLPMNIRKNFLSDRMVGCPCCPRDSQESFPIPHQYHISPIPFKGISSLVLNFLYSPTITSIHDYWKNHCFD